MCPCLQTVISVKNYETETETETSETSAEDIFCFQAPLIPEMLLFYIAISLFFKAESMWRAI